MIDSIAVPASHQAKLQAVLTQGRLGAMEWLAHAIDRAHGELPDEDLPQIERIEPPPVEDIDASFAFHHVSGSGPAREAVAGETIHVVETEHGTVLAWSRQRLLAEREAHSLQNQRDMALRVVARQPQTLPPAALELTE